MILHIHPLFTRMDMTELKYVDQLPQSGALMVQKETVTIPHDTTVFLASHTFHQKGPIKAANESSATVSLSPKTFSTSLLLEEVAQTNNQPRKRLFRSNHLDGQPLLRCVNLTIL